MIRQILVNGLRAKLMLVLLLGTVAVATPTLTPSPASAASPCPYQGGHPMLYEGINNSQDVAHAQCLLNKLHKYNNIAIDGDFGPKTREAIEWFQGQKGLYADGVVGPCTWAALHPDGEPDDYCYAPTFPT